MENEKECKIFALRLRGRRLRLGLSQKDLARKMGASPRALQYWERGRSLPTGKKLRALCAALELKTSYFFGPELPDEISDPGGVAEACAEYLQRFLAECQHDPSRLGWTLVELQARFPMDKWRRHHITTYPATENQTARLNEDPPPTHPRK